MSNQPLPPESKSPEDFIQEALKELENSKKAISFVSEFQIKYAKILKESYDIFSNLEIEKDRQGFKKTVENMRSLSIQKCIVVLEMGEREIECSKRSLELALAYEELQLKTLELDQLIAPGLNNDIPNCSIKDRDDSLTLQIQIRQMEIEEALKNVNQLFPLPNWDNLENK